VFAGRQRGDRDRVVQVVRRADADRIEIVPRDQTSQSS
jgi:hypothetical protein